MIDNKYEYHVNNPSDIHEHMTTIKEYSDKCNHITEFGVRFAVSTYAFLASSASKVISYDIGTNDKIIECKKICEEEDRDWIFIECSTLECNIEPTELLFIDTLHTYNQLIQELRIHSHKVSKYIIMHDTTTYGRRGEHGDTKGLMDAIELFIKEDNNWEIELCNSNCNGLTILKRI